MSGRGSAEELFYPDLPKGYQISMYELPLATGGVLEIEIEGRAKKIGITRLHMEEDAAKNLHEGFPDSDKWSYIDFNRGGVPLVEIVSDPDIRSPSAAYQYLNTLKQVLEYTDERLQHGRGFATVRCERGVAAGESKFGTKVEVKNLNSFRYLSHALEFEIERAGAGIGWKRYAGDAALECGGRTDGIDAIERIRARLPLFSRSGFAAGYGDGAARGRGASRNAGIAGSKSGAICRVVRNRCV
jgi:hypothetical protein